MVAMTVRRQELNFAYLRIRNVLRCQAAFHPLHAWSPSDYGNAMAGEAGEACNFVKKLRRLQDDRQMEPDKVRERTAFLVGEIGKELADTIIYADLLAARLGLNLSEHIFDKFNEVSQRRGVTVFLEEDATLPAVHVAITVLRELEAHHVGLNRDIGRDPSRSRTLALARSALQALGTA